MGAFLGISARTPAKRLSIVAQLLASCEQSPFAAQFVYNLMGPIFYELTMMALPSEELQLNRTTASTLGQSNCNPAEEQAVKVDTILKFLCFVYMESSLQYESTEDVFETLTFCDQFEVAELQDYCATSLKSFSDNCQGRRSTRDRLLGKRICDYLVLFLGGRIPFYFNEEELTLLHSVFIETVLVLDVFCARHSEFDIAQSGILWVQRKLMISPPPLVRHPSLALSSRMVHAKKKCHIWTPVVLMNLLAICSSVNIIAGGKEPGPVRVDFQILVQCALILCSAIWTWARAIRYGQQRRIILLMYLANADALEGIIAGNQPALSEIIHFGSGS